MKSLFIIPLVLMSLVSSPSWALSEDDLVIRAGLYYEKFSATPFTGELDEGLVRGSIKNGKMEGSYEDYFKNGQLFMKGSFKNGKEEGYWEFYMNNGQSISKGSFKNGKEEGYWEYYRANEQLSAKGTLKNGKKEGYWESYNEDGSVNTKYNGTYKNGVKVGD